MGYARYTIHRNGMEIDAGYDVEATCEESGCTTTIDRSLAFLCGNTPGGDEFGCGGYFCHDHLFLSLHNGPGDLCATCLDATENTDETALNGVGEAGGHR